MPSVSRSPNLAHAPVDPQHAATASSPASGAGALQQALGNSAVLDLVKQGAGALNTESFAALSRGSSVPLPYKAEMEAAFGQSFGDLDVRVDPSAALGAAGVTAANQGNRLLFSNERPNREVVAHELAHVAQRRGSLGASGGASAESEADQVAAAVCKGETPGPLKHAPAVVAAKTEAPKDTESEKVAQLVAANGQTFQDFGYSSEKDGAIVAAVMMNETEPNGYREGINKNFNGWALKGNINGGAASSNSVEGKVNQKVSSLTDLYQLKPEALASRKLTAEQQAELLAFQSAVSRGDVSAEDLKTLQDKNATAEAKAKASQNLRDYVVKNVSSESILGKMSPKDAGYESYARKKWMLDQARANPETATSLLTLMNPSASDEDKANANEHITDVGVDYRVNQYERLKELKGSKKLSASDKEELTFLKGLKLKELEHKGSAYGLEDLEGMSSERFREVYAPGVTRFEPHKYKQMKTHYQQYSKALASKNPASASKVEMDDKDGLLMKDVIGGHEQELEAGNYDHLADLATSYTGAQIMGFNVASGKLKTADGKGNYSIVDLKKASATPEPDKLSMEIVLSYFKNFTAFTSSSALRDKSGDYNYKSVADAYNGPSSDANDYSGRLKTNVDRYQKAVKAMQPSQPQKVEPKSATPSAGPTT